MSKQFKKSSDGFYHYYIGEILCKQITHPSETVRQSLQRQIEFWQKRGTAEGQAKVKLFKRALKGLSK